MRSLIVAFLLSFTSTAYAQIADNSFLQEEAYNQGENEVQHILTFERDLKTADWEFAFEQEWPLGSQAHQLSFELALQSVSGTVVGRATGMGDVTLSYRYQVLGIDDDKVALAPRATVILPIGDDDKGLGNGAIGYEIGLPLSLKLGDLIAAHTNAYASVTPSAFGSDERLSTIGVGQSIVFMVGDNFNLLAEALWESSSLGGADLGSALTINPGLRWAHDLEGMQIVPGVSLPMTFGDGETSTSLFLYLSFEHDF